MDTETVAADIACEVVPRRDATSDELVALGEALARWSESELRPGGLLRSIDNIVLVELLAGDALVETVFAVLGALEQDDVLTITRRASTHTDPSAAAHALTVACEFRGDDYDRGRVVASLRAGLPAYLVGDVLIGGTSWNEV